MTPSRKVRTIAPLTASVIPLPDLKAACRVDHTDEDTLIESYGLAASARAETVTGKLMSPRTITLRLADLPCGRKPVFLPGGPVVSIASVTVDGTAVLGCAAYGDAPAHLVPAEDWPSITAEGYPVVIEYTAGFSTVPADIAIAIRIMTADLYDRRASASTDQAYAAPLSAMALLEPHRILPW